MRINLNQKEIKKILVDKYGEAEFEIFYEESDDLWEKRNNQSISELKEAPNKFTCLIYL